MKEHGFVALQPLLLNCLASVGPITLEPFFLVIMQIFFKSQGKEKRGTGLIIGQLYCTAAPLHPLHLCLYLTKSSAAHLLPVQDTPVPRRPQRDSVWTYKDSNDKKIFEKSK